MNIRRMLRDLQEQPLISKISACLMYPFHRIAGRLRTFITWHIRVNGATIHSDGITLKFPPNVGIIFSTLLWWEGLQGYEPATWKIIKSIAPRCSAFLDIGSNIGLFAVLASKLSPQLSVDAFEPVPSLHEGNCRFHKANGLSPDQVHRLAISEQDGKLKIFVRSYAGHREAEGTSTLENDFNLSPGSDSTEVDVTTIRLDTFLGQSTRPDPLFIKIDVEGHELAVLKGAETTITQRRPIILCEILPVSRTAIETYRLLASWNCLVCAVARDGLYVIAETDMMTSRQFNDVLVIPRERWPGGNHLPYADLLRIAI